MGRYPRFIPPGSTVEVTNRTAQGRFLLRPSPELTTIAVGVLGRAQRLYPLEIHHFKLMSGHFHMILTTPDAQRLSSFMGYFQANLAKEAGRLHGWRGKIWGRRFRAIPIDGDERIQIARLVYLLANGCKENLVASPRDWPGASCLGAWLSSEPLKGLWFDRTKEWSARQRRVELAPLDFAEPEEVHLSPLPCWKHLPRHAIRARIANHVRQVEKETAERHTAGKTRPLGVKGVLDRDPHDTPERMSISPAPLFHTATRQAYWDLYQAMSTFVADYYEARDRLRAGLVAAFPAGSFPSPLALVPL